jgi:peptide/nickel transport system substrate-binding protein
MVCCLCLSLLACQGRGTDLAEIRLATAQAPLNLDPRYASDAASERINRLLYQSMVSFDAHFQAQPQLADWQQVDALHYYFRLKTPLSHFHDGSLLRAQDVVATYQSLLVLKDSPHTAEFSNIAALQALDDTTLALTLHQADSLWPSRMTIGILPAKLIAQKHDFSHDPVGSGPLKFVSWPQDVVLQRVQDGQNIRILEVKDPTVRMLKLLRSEVDLLQGDLAPELVRYLKQQSTLQVLDSTGVNFSYIGLNLQDAELRKPLVRQALAHAIDRPAIIQQVMLSNTRLANSILPPEHWAGNPDLVGYDYNPALSRQLLQQAGIKLPLKLVYKTSTDAQRVRLATIMQAQMQAAGIELQINSLDWGTFFADVQQGKFQLYGLTWVGIKTPDIYHLAFHSDAIPPAGANRGHLRDSQLDKLLDAQNWQAASQRIHQQLPYIPLWYEGQFAAMQQNIMGYSLSADGNWDGLVTVTRQ